MDWKQKGRERADNLLRFDEVRSWWRTGASQAQVEDFLRKEFSDLLSAAQNGAGLAAGIAYGYARPDEARPDMVRAGQIAVIAAEFVESFALRLLVEGFRERLGEIVGAAPQQREGE